MFYFVEIRQRKAKTTARLTFAGKVKNNKKENLNRKSKLCNKIKTNIEFPDKKKQRDKHKVLKRN